MIHTGDCITVMAGMEPDSVDAVVTDPPYGLEFMGREWDRFDGGQQARWKGRKQKAGRFDTDGLGAAELGKRLSARPNFGSDSRGQKCRKCGHYKFSGTPCKCAEPEWEIRTGTPPNMAAFQAWCEAWGREALRVTKPGGYLLAFGGTRTHHRLVCGLEDAGWIIRDELTWVYASGFPKGKANLKPAHEPIVLARKPGPLRPLAIDAGRIGTEPMPHIPGELGAEGIYGRMRRHPFTCAYCDGADRPEWKTQQEYLDHMKTVHPGLPNEPDPQGRWPSNLLLSDPALFDEPNPEVVGSGATAGSVNKDFGQSGYRQGGGDGPSVGLAGSKNAPDSYGDTGGYSRFFRIPRHEDGSYLIHPDGTVCGGEDCPVLDDDGNHPNDYIEREQGDYPKAFIVPKAGRSDREPVLRGQLAKSDLRTMGDGAGEWSQHGPENENLKRENAHPTVKPVDLMRHLVRLVTPSRNEDGEPGLVLDPFLGSGSTALACELEGFRWIGIEKEPEYVAIAEARLNGTQRGLGLDVALVGEPRKSSVNKPTEWKSDGEGSLFGDHINRRKAGTIRSGYDQVHPRASKAIAPTDPIWTGKPEEAA